jgi:hypothetical protein
VADEKIEENPPTESAAQRRRTSRRTVISARTDSSTAWPRPLASRTDQITRPAW